MGDDSSLKTRVGKISMVYSNWGAILYCTDVSVSTMQDVVGSPGYQCACVRGWTGGDCTLSTGEGEIYW